jgi:hypothetical protein
MAVAANVLLSQLGWFACVLGASQGLPWIGVLAAALVIGWHLLRAIDPRRELWLIASAAASGALFETILVQTGLVRYGNGILLEGAAPYWMVTLWAIFATTLNVSLRSLRPRLWLAAAFGAVGGPAAYYSGARLGALEFASAGTALAVIAAGWTTFVPVLFSAARRLDGYARA